MEKKQNNIINYTEKIKKMLILLVVIIATILLLGVVCLILKGRTNTNYTPYFEYKQINDQINITCLNSNNVTPTLYYQGEEINCNISYDLTDSINKSVTEIMATFTVDSNMELVDTTNILSSWKEVKKGINFKLTTDSELVKDNNFYTVKFKIKGNTDKDIISLGLNDVYVKTKDNKYYKLDNSNIKIMIAVKNNYRFETDEENNKIVFYKSTKDGYKEINKYTCKTSCHEYASEHFSYIDNINGRMFILDNNDKEAILYDYNRGIIATYQVPVYALYDKYMKYFIAKNSEDMYGIISLDGNIVRPFVSTSLGKIHFGEIHQDTYSIYNNLIIEKQNDKYGITNINKISTVIDYKYDDIRFLNNEYIKVKEEDNWYLYTLKDYKKALDKSYQEIFMPNDNILIVKENNYLYIKDKKGNNLIEDKISSPLKHDEEGYNFGIEVFLDNQDNNIIYIVVYQDTTSTTADKYIYNIKENKLTKKDSN